MRTWQLTVNGGDATDDDLSLDEADQIARKIQEGYVGGYLDEDEDEGQ